MSRTEIAERVARVPAWYHTFEFDEGVVTDGHFDLRGVVDRLPWPDLTGARCLDVATFDGFYAFEMERRGASEVVAIDLDDAVDLDWLPRCVPEALRRGDEPIGYGFRLAREMHGSDVHRVSCSVYDLDPSELGTFDFINCGALLQHLREPLRALEAMRPLCRGTLQSIELIRISTTVLHPRKPLMTIVGRERTWAVPNAAGHRRMLEATGWDVVRREMLSMPLGPGGAPSNKSRLRTVGRNLLRRFIGGSADPPFSVLLATPAPNLAPRPA